MSQSCFVTYRGKNSALPEDVRFPDGKITCCEDVCGGVDVDAECDNGESCNGDEEGDDGKDDDDAEDDDEDGGGEL